MKHARFHEASRPYYSRNSLRKTMLRPLTPAPNCAQTAANRALSCSKPRRIVPNPPPIRSDSLPKKQKMEQTRRPPMNGPACDLSPAERTWCYVPRSPVPRYRNQRYIINAAPTIPNGSMAPNQAVASNWAAGGAPPAAAIPWALIWAA